MIRKSIEVWVGLLMVMGALALAFLAFKVSGLSINNDVFGAKSYNVTAVFSDIGGLKVRAPVRIAGVQIGTVTGIALDPQTYQAQVTLTINDGINNLPSDTSASVTSSGILGDNYVSLSPGYSDTTLKNGGKIITTYSATNLQSLISTFISNSNSNGAKK
ncbi:MAG: outer rane lipid asymmetry maintenance protein MlaD [Gammaproteobacteria bacterium]|jgi:phospholipid/cholesterol/gamma-HCH transport system substrate-binding protein|nr:outer rane lipid asymmetry maintenance protein MlaD [Gammaproteobacteria bacterium]